MAKRTVQKNGKEAFNDYYGAVFGARWEQLQSALAGEVRSCAYEANLAKPYYLDVGSVAAASALPLEGAKAIADMCAAPGGKSLVIASRMGKDATLVANERSRERKARLLRVLDEHLPPATRERVRVTGFDAARWCRYELDAYDRILLDVPCSSERHVFADETYLSQWSPARIRNLAVTQWAILSSAFLVLKKGGYLVYSTCALSRAENDDVVSRLLKKYKNAKVVPLKETDVCALCGAEKTVHGMHVLPDVQNGAGPIFFSLLYKSSMD